MKAAYVKAGKRIDIREVPRPMAGPGEVVLRITACGVCGSDFLEATRWAKDWKRFGHELTAVVHGVGEGVIGFTEGDRVAMALSVPCGQCDACRKEMPRFCSDLVLAEQGGFAEYLLVRDARLLRPVKAALSDQLLCLIEPLSVILDAFGTARLNMHQDALLVAGGGFLGSLALLVAKAKGIAVSGVLSRRETVALRSILSLTGGEFVKWPTGLWRRSILSSPDLNAVMRRHIGRLVVLHTAPPSAIADYVGALPYGAEVINIGLSGEARKNQVKFDGANNIFRRIQILSSFPVPCLTLDAAISLLEEHADLFSLLEITALPLQELPDVIKSPRPGKKIIVI
jgi:L-iditol 2-dehydrogenase